MATIVDETTKMANAAVTLKGENLTCEEFSIIETEILKKFGGNLCEIFYSDREVKGLFFSDPIELSPKVVDEIKKAVISMDPEVIFYYNESHKGAPSTYFNLIRREGEKRLWEISLFSTRIYFGYPYSLNEPTGVARKVLDQVIFPLYNLPAPIKRLRTLETLAQK